MTCQYCHSKDHTINNCPNIICRYCKQVGHPKWLCKNKNNIENKEKKYYNDNEKIKKQIDKNINYYLKLQKYKWSEIINYY